MKKIGIVSCKKWIGKIEEDILLKDAILASGKIAEIISWEDSNIDFKDYDCLILRSVWGYQNKLIEFENWLNYLDENNITILNNTNIIRNNIYKSKQFEILEKNKIPIIPTQFMQNRNDFEKFLKNPFESHDLMVIKPIVSGSGENTYVISKEKNCDIKNLISLDSSQELFGKIILEKGVMIQPFIQGIFDGEYSLIYIGKENTHNFLRCPSVFHDHRRKEYIDDIPNSILEISKNIIEIPEFQDYLYMRIDMVIDNNIPLLMEVELAEPDLLLREIPDNLLKQKILKQIVSGIERNV